MMSTIDERLYKAVSYVLFAIGFIIWLMSVTAVTATEADLIILIILFFGFLFVLNKGIKPQNEG